MDLAGEEPKALILTENDILARQHQDMVLRYGQGVVGKVYFLTGCLQTIVCGSSVALL